MDDLTVKVGADITGFLSKIDAAKAKVNQLTEEQQGLKTVINDLNNSLRLNEKELTVASVKLQKLNTTTVQGKQAATALRAEIGKLATNSRVLSESLTGAKTNLARTTSELKLSTAQLKTAQTSVGGFAGGVKTAFGGLRSLANIIPGLGIAGLVGMIAGPLADALVTWYKGLNKISIASQILKETNADLNDIMKDANKDAGEQTAKLKILYAAATNVTLSMKDRHAAVNALQLQFPTYFKNISDENILNGQAKDVYDKLAKSIQETARAKAALSKLGEIESAQLDLDFKRDKVWIAYTDELNAARKKGALIYKQSLGAPDIVFSVKQQEAGIAKKRELALEGVEIDQKILNGRREFITKSIGLDKLATAAIPPPKITPDAPKTVKHIETINEVLAQMRAEIVAIEEIAILKNLDASLDRIKVGEATAIKLIKQFKLEASDPVIQQLAFEFGLGERGELRKELQKIVPKDIGVPIALTLAPSSAVFPVFKQLTEQVLPEVKKFNQEVSSILQSGLENALSGVGEAIGTAIAEGGDVGKAIFGNLFKVIGQGLKDLGKAMIGLGTTKKALEAFHITPGIGTIIAGVAAIALGQLLQSSMPKFAVGGPVQGPGTRTSDSILARLSRGEYVMKADAVSKFGAGFFEMLNRGFMPRGMATGGSVGSSSIGGGQLITVEVQGNIRGRDIHLSNSRTGIMLGRNG